jgi:hypothetical protein
MGEGARTTQGGLVTKKDMAKAIAQELELPQIQTC